MSKWEIVFKPEVEEADILLAIAEAVRLLQEDPIAHFHNAYRLYEEDTEPKQSVGNQENLFAH